MKKSGYWLLGITAAFNGLVALVAADSKLLWDKVVKFLLNTHIDIGLRPEDAKPLLNQNADREQGILRYLRIPGAIIAAGVLIGLVLTVFCVKVFLGYFEKFSKKTRILTVSTAAFVEIAAGIGAYYAFRSEANWLFFLLSALAFAALVVLITAVYRLIGIWLNDHGRAGVILSALFGVICLPMVLVAFSSESLVAMSGFELMGIYAASVGVSTFLFIFGVAALVSVFVKGSRFSWVRPAAAVLLVVLICFSVITVLLTGLTSGTGNFIKNASIDVGMVRLGLTDDDFVCAYEGGDGERIYLLKTGRTDSDAELSELLECTKLGDVYQRTVNGVEYKHICLDYFGGYYIFTVIPA